MGEDSDIKVAIKYLREASILLLVAQVLSLLMLLNELYLINITIAAAAVLAAIFIKIIPSALLLARQGKEFNLIGKLIKYCYWSSLAIQGFALPLLLAGRVSSHYRYWGVELGEFSWLVEYLFLILRPTIFPRYAWYTTGIQSANSVGVLGLNASLAAGLLVFIGWAGFLMLLYKLSSLTGITDFQTSATLMACAVLFSFIPFPVELLWIAACYKLWVGASNALEPVTQVEKPAKTVKELEVEKLLPEIKFLEGVVKEYEGYLLKLEQMHERGEVIDEVYQDLKNMYTEEFEKNRSKLEELKKKLEEDKGTQVKTMRVEGFDSSALLKTEHTIGYTPWSNTILVKGKSKASTKASAHPYQRRVIGAEAHPAEMQEIIEEIEGPPLFLFLLFVFVTLASITLAVIFDPIFSIIVFVLLVIVIAAGYRMGSQEVVEQSP